MTWFKPPYWVRSRTHLRNGCNRFPPCRGLPPLRPPSSSPPCAALPSPPAPRPPLRPTFLSPLCRDLLKPPLAPPLRCPPLRGRPPLHAALPRRYADPRSASRRSGDGRPRFGHGPAADAAWRGLRRGLAIPRPAVTPAASTAGLRVELARWRLLALRLGRCPRREDRRGSSRRSAALSWPPAAAPPCGLRVGARAS